MVFARRRLAPKSAACSGTRKSSDVGRATLWQYPLWLLCVAIVIGGSAADELRADRWKLASLLEPEDEELVDGLPPNGGLPPGSYVDLDAYLQGEPTVGPFSDEPWSWQVLPSGLIYKTYLAGTKEPRLGTQWFNKVHDGWLWDASLGSRVGVWRYGSENPFYPQGLQLDVEGAAFVRLNPEEHVDVESVDFRGGLPLSFGHGRHQTKFGYYHISSHLGDEFLIRNPGYFRLNYARDCLLLGHSIYITENLRVYAEMAWAFYSDVSENWEFQFGVDYAPLGPTGPAGRPFFAINGHLREEIDYSGAVTLQTGWAWRSQENSHLLRVGLHIYNGLSNQFSFYNQHEQQVGLGVWHDF